MDKEEGQADGPSRRRSMLPQKTRVKSASKPVGLFPKQDSLNATMLPPSKIQSHASIRYPVNVRQVSSKPDPAKIGHVLGQPSVSRTSSRNYPSATGVNPTQKSRDLSQPRLQVRASSGSSDPQSKTQESSHGRYSSQQIRAAATSDLLHPRAFPRRQSSIKNAKPAFSAMQQHLGANMDIQLEPSLSSQPTGKETSPSTDSIYLQMELAQLHVLHRSVLSVQSQWKRSAKASFEHRYNFLFERHDELKEIASQQQTLINQLSLVHWSQGRSRAQVAEKVQLLSRNISDICKLLDFEGKYTQILDTFESWFTQALRVRGQRESSGQETGTNLGFIDGIGDGWKAEAMVLERELTYSTRDLESFGDVSKNSNLSRMLSMYKKLVAGLLEELDLIQWIENEIMSHEALWAERTIHNVVANGNEDTDPIASGLKVV